MFIRPHKSDPEPHVRLALSELGYAFDLTDGRLRNTATGQPYEYSAFGADKKKNAELYQALLAPASREVYRVLVESDLCMEPIAVPDARQPHCNIYVTPGGLSKERLVVIVTGHGVCGGVWAWNVLVKEGLRAGSVVEYVRGCMQRGFGVLVLNPNENIVTPDGFPETFNSYSGYSTPIYCSETADEHVGYVWSRIVRGAAAKSVAFIAYNTAGMAMVDLLKHDFARFASKSSGIAFIDSVHSTFQLGKAALKWLQLAARQWENSDEPADTQVINNRVGCVAVSAGNPTDCRELAPLSCMNSVLDYVTECFAREPIDVDSLMALNDGTDIEDLSDEESGSSDTDGPAAIGDLDGIHTIQPDSQVTDDNYVGWD
ncbi:hypothetical protein GGI20_002391 [Coemansia sp. BCRC 34301]|nr:hypothetical protein GGI20_002391 [Coemansia sp. BCRC 34301]